MARKKMEDGGGGGNAPWLATFADLMNLLLCLFIMIVAYSNVDAEKFEKLSISMANSFGVFQGGGSSIGNGQLISSGLTQKTELSQYFSKMGETSHKSKLENEGEYDPTNPENTKDNIDNSEGSSGAQNQGNNGSQSAGGSSGNNSAGAQNKEIGLEEALNKLEKERIEVTSGMYDKISDLTDSKNLGDYVELSIDSDYEFVLLTLRGSILFDSGEAEIKELAEPILQNIGDILKIFKGYRVEITGHTDNVPMTSKSFKDNNWLSSARALNAAEFLIDECGIDPALLKYSGRGEYEPISSNATADGRAKNRRIEIRIYNEYSGR